MVQPGQQRVGVDAETDVVKAEAMDKGKIVRSGIGAKAFGAVTAGSLGKPVAGVDAVAQMACTLKRN